MKKSTRKDSIKNEIISDNNVKDTEKPNQRKYSIKTATIVDVKEV